MRSCYGFYYDFIILGQSFQENIPNCMIRPGKAFVIMVKMHKAFLAEIGNCAEIEGETEKSLTKL